jgi:hypothetical protein
MFETNINIEYIFTWKDFFFSFTFILKFKNLTIFIFVFVTFWVLVVHERCFVMMFDGCMCG